MRTRGSVSLGPMLPAPPADVLDIAGPVDHWQLVETTSPGASQVWLTPDVAVKRVSSADEGVLRAEAANATALRPNLPTARPVVASVDEAFAWLVSERLSGSPAHRPDLHGDVGSLANAAGRTLASLHALPFPDHDLPTGWAALRDDLERSVSAGDVDDATLPEPYNRYSPTDLLAMWTESPPLSDDLVLCHGDPSLPNFLVEQGQLTGLVDLGGMRIADRHLDLAIAHRSVQRNLGPEAVYVFYEAYGADPDMLRLDHYLLGSLLLP